MSKCLSEISRDKIHQCDSSSNKNIKKHINKSLHHKEKQQLVSHLINDISSNPIEPEAESASGNKLLLSQQKGKPMNVVTNPRLEKRYFK